jgi:hypothetical protein
MRTVDYSQTIVIYNLVVGVLLFTSGRTLASYAGALGFSLRGGVERYAATALRTLGGTWAVISGSIYVLFHLLRIGVD